jgi:OmpA-OmpF porin, OOP family
LKNSLIAATLLATAFVSTGAMAQGYVSADVGVGHASIDCTGIASCDDNGTSFKVTAGYKLGYGFAAEFGYIDFGKAKASDTGFDAKFEAKAWTLGAAYELPIAADFSGVARLGVASVKTTASATITGVGSGSDSDTKTEAYYGLGANYAVAKNIKIKAGVDWSHAEYAGTTTVVRSISAGVQYEF